MTHRLDTVWRLRAMHLLIGLMFFYGIEQLFFGTILHDDAARGAATVSYVVALLLFDIPTGWLADKFGRRRSLITACCILVLTLLVLGTSHSLWAYMLGSALYGVYTAFYNGAAQALLYDYLKEKGDAERYARYQGQNQALFLAGAAIANLLSGFIASTYSIRAAYFLSMIPATLAIVVIWGIREAKHYEQDTPRRLPLISALRQVRHEIRLRPRIILFGLQFVMFQTFLLTIGEFGQVYILSFGFGAVALGILWGIGALISSAAQLTAQQLRTRPRLWIGLYCLLIGIFITIRSEVGIGFFWILYGLAEVLSTVAEAEVQAETSSPVRATMLSTVSFASNSIGIPTLILYTIVFKHHGVFAANTILGSIIGITLLLTLFVRPPKASEQVSPVAPIVT